MDSFTEVENVGWGRRIKEAIGGMVFGLILFVGSFPVLWVNEGCAVKDYEAWQYMADQAVEVSSGAVDGANEGKLVNTNGKATTQDTVRDTQFDVAVTAIRLSREVEMYQWKETVSEKTEKKMGGGERKVKTYDYSQVWSGQHIDSTKFKHREGHENPSSMPFKSNTFNAQKVTLGEFNLNQALISQIGGFQGHTPDEVPDVGRPIHKHAGGFYLGEDPGDNKIGDLKVSFKKATDQDVTVTAQQSGAGFQAFSLPNDREAHRLDSGLLNMEQVHAAADSETAFRTWLIRLGGFLAMFFGICLVTKPLSVVADVIPIIGSIVGGITGFVGFFIALALSATTIAIAWVAYRPLLAGILFAVALAGIIFGFMMRQKPAHG